MFPPDLEARQAVDVSQTKKSRVEFWWMKPKLAPSPQLASRIGRLPTEPALWTSQIPRRVQPGYCLSPDKIDHQGWFAPGGFLSRVGLRLRKQGLGRFLIQNLRSPDHQDRSLDRQGGSRLGGFLFSASLPVLSADKIKIDQVAGFVRTGLGGCFFRVSISMDDRETRSPQTSPTTATKRPKQRSNPSKRAKDEAETPNASSNRNKYNSKKCQ